MQPGQHVLDLGCGNGRIADLTDEIKLRYTGMDISEEMITIARQLRPQHQFSVGSILDTGFADNSFDHVLMIASFHHIPSEDLRLKALDEVKRILKPGGLILMTNWNLHQWRYLRQRLHTNAEKLLGHHQRDFNDLLIPWKDGSGQVHAERYYHSFTKKEIVSLARRANLRLLDNYYDSNGMRVPRRKAHNLMSVLSS